MLCEVKDRPISLLFLEPRLPATAQPRDIDYVFSIFYHLIFRSGRSFAIARLGPTDV